MQTIDAIKRLLRRVLVPLATAAALSGCAHTYVNADGTRNIVGLVWARLPVADSRGAEALRVRSVGVSITTSPAGAAFVLGYSDSNVVVVRDNQFVDATPLLDPPR